MLKFQSGYYYIKDTDEDKVVSGILTKKEAKKKLRVLEVDEMFNKMLDEKGTLGIPKDFRPLGVTLFKP